MYACILFCAKKPTMKIQPRHEWYVSATMMPSSQLIDKVQRNPYPLVKFEVIILCWTGKIRWMCVQFIVSVALIFYGFVAVCIPVCHTHLHIQMHGD